MSTDLKASIRKALAGSSSQQPVDVSKLYKLGNNADVEAALLEMYHSSKACCCLVTRRGATTSLWWLVGAVCQPNHYSKSKKRAAT